MPNFSFKNSRAILPNIKEFPGLYERGISVKYRLQILSL